MKFLNYAAAVAVAAGITVSGLRPAYGDLVFENDLSNKPAAQPGATTTTADSDPGQMSKSEMMRRERLRQEMKNEDILTQKLEELRLKDEMKRTEELSSASSASAVGKSAPEQQPLQEQKIGSAATAATGPSASSGAPATVAAAPAPEAAGSSGQSVAVAPAAKDEKSDSDNHIMIAPKFGTSSITSTIVNVSAKWGAGVDLGMDVSDNFTVLGGYTYSTYSLAAGNNVSYPYGFNQQANLQTLNLNDNVINLGARFYITGHQSRVRPFIGGGGAYRRGYVNYDSNTQQLLTNLYGAQAAQDVVISGMEGYVEAGADVKITNSVSLVGSFRYFDVLSSSQSNPINPNAFVGPGGYASAYSNPLSYNSNTTAAAAGNALAGQNFYQLMGGIQVTF